MNSASNQPISDTVNLQEENPRIFIGSALAEKTENEAGASPPFYITLTVHEQILPSPTPKEQDEPAEKASSSNPRTQRINQLLRQVYEMEILEREIKKTMLY